MPISTSQNIAWLDQWPEDAPCLQDDKSAPDWITAGSLLAKTRLLQSTLPEEKQLIFLYARNDIPTVTAFLACLAGGHAVALFDPALGKEAKEALEAIYTPNIVIDTAFEEYVDVRHSQQLQLNTDLALLLSTSGSTGSPKLVRLTLANIETNAAAIATSQSLSADDIAAGHLPLHYSFGLSVLSSHLFARAKVRLTERSFTDRLFWNGMKEAEITHLPGVPFHMQMLEKLGYKRINLPKLRILAQAGGHLPLSSKENAYQAMEDRGGRFYVMYGQTEAAPRITTLQHEDFPIAPNSVGHALRGGRLEIEAPDPSGQGEVIYHGPNVMLGYAESLDDLAKGDELFGRLKTGDIGRIDDAGRLTITGRIKRFGKIFGLRVNLDEIEKKLSSLSPCAVVQEDESIIIYLTTSEDVGNSLHTIFLSTLSSSFNLPKTCYVFRYIDELPRTERGKIDYKALGRQ